MTLGHVLAYNLGLDVGALGDPLTIYNANTTVFAASSNVPAWLYTPLWISLGAPSSNLSSVIIPDYGLAQTPATACIVIQSTEIYESAEVVGMRSQLPGARTCQVDILVKNISTAKSIKLVNDVTNRVVYLLDYFCRENRTLNVDTADLIIPTNITGFYQSPFRCYHLATILPIAKESRISFRVEFAYTFV